MIEDCGQLAAISHREGVPSATIEECMLKTTNGNAMEIGDGGDLQRLVPMSHSERKRIMTSTLPRLKESQRDCVDRLLLTMEQL
eukprot:m.178132 g.178132  ORF g.178132 m.178132 type:complete len:84 (+) comp16585_c0_seq5:2539-2790(+)